MWGFNHLAFYSLAVRLIAFTFIALFFVPRFGRWTIRLLKTSAEILLENSSRSRAIRICVLILAFILFLSLQSSTLLLGDGRYIANNMRLAVERDTLGVSNYFKAITLKEPVYPATDFLFFLAAGARKNVAGANPLTGIRILIALIGCMFILSLLHFGRRSRAPLEVLVPLFVLVCFSGGIELFFGYIESYAPPALAATLYIFTAWRAFNKKDSIWLPLLCFAAGCALHMQCLLLAPSCIFLIVDRFTNNHKNRPPKWIPMIIIILTIVGALFASRLPALERYFVPLRATASSYGVFSVTHFIDIFNEIMLIFPTGAIFVFIAVHNRSRSGGERSTDGVFAWLLLIPSILFLFFFRPELGMARDWDLFSLISLGLFPAAFVALKRFYSLCGAGSVLRPSAMPVLAIHVVLAAAWVGMNASESKSVARFESILEYDRTKAGYAYENLSMHFKDARDLDRTIDALEKAYAASGNPRYISNLGQYYIQRGDTLKALEAYRECLRKAPGYEIARKNFIRLLGLTNRMDEFIEACREGAELDPTNPYYPFWLGQAYIRKGMSDEATTAFRRCGQLNPPAELINEMNRLMRPAPGRGEIPKQR